MDRGYCSQIPAITELAQLDSTGKEQVRQSKLAMDVAAVMSIFLIMQNWPRQWPRRSTTARSISGALALARIRRDAGVSVAEVNLKLFWDVISQIKVGEPGRAYAVDDEGRLIAHPAISLVLRNTDMTYWLCRLA